MATPITDATVTAWQAGGTVHTAEMLRSMIGALAPSIGGIGRGQFDVTIGTGLNLEVTGGVAVVPDPATRQAYTVALPDNAVTLTQTGTSTRSDLLVIRVSDAHAGDGVHTDGEDPVSLHIIPDVPATTTTLTGLTGTTHPMLPLARIDLPTDATTLAAATITPLAPVIGTAARTETRTVVAASDETFGTAQGVIMSTQQPAIPAPTWARTAHCAITLHGLDAGTSDSRATFAAGINSTIGDEVTLDLPTGHPASVTVGVRTTITSPQTGQNVIPKLHAYYDDAFSGIPTTRTNKTSATYTVTFEA